MCSSHGQRATNSVTHIQGSHTFTHTLTYINTVTTMLCEAPAQLLHILESILKVPEGGGGGKTEYPEKNPDTVTACPLVGITY